MGWPFNTPPVGYDIAGADAAIATAVTGLYDFKGSTDCSANPNYPSASKGDIYMVSVAGKIGGASGTTVAAGDQYVAIADNAGGTQAAVGSSWGVIETNQVQASTTSAGYVSELATDAEAIAGADTARVLTPSNLAALKAGIPFSIDGSGVAITTGVKGYIVIPFDCTITGWDLVADQSGSIVIDVWKDTYANFPPTVADTIAGSEKPTLSSVQKNQDLTLSSWTTAITAGDVLGFNVDSAATVTRVMLTLRVTGAR